MLRKIKSFFTKKAKQENPKPDAEVNPRPAEGVSDFNPYSGNDAESTATIPSLRTSSVHTPLKIVEEDTMRKPLPEGLTRSFRVDEYDLKPLGDEATSLIQRNNPKKPWWLVFLTDVFNGLVLAITLFLTAGLLTESYLKDNYPFLAWLAFIPFGIALLNMRSALLSWVYGLAAGTLFYLGILYWIYPTVQVGTGNPGLAAAGVLALALVLSMQFSLFTLSCYFIKRIKWLFPLAGACAWVSFEILHQYFAYKFMAFPWFVLGYTQFENIPLIQISSVTGVYGVSFLMVFFGLSMAYISGRVNKFFRIIYFILPLACMILAYSYGNKTVKEQENFIQTNPQKIAIALMQPNTHATLLEGYTEDVVYMIAEQVTSLKNKKVDFIIWPESSLPGTFQKGDFYDFMLYVSKELQVWQLVGSASEKDGVEYVSAGLFNENGLKDIYNKNKLVPFGEFLPMVGVLQSLYEKYGISSFTGTFAEGKDPGKIMDLTIKNENEKQKTYLFGTEICFESLFPSIFRAQALSGAEFFVNISNDGWFLDTAAPYQHLRVNVFRAVENRRPLLRATNTGISAWIDSLGKIKFQSQLNKQETAVFNFAFQPRTSKTFYTGYGDIFGYICAAVALTVLVVGMVFFSLNKND